MIFNLTSPVIRSKDHVPVLGEDFTYSGSCTVIDDSNDAEGVQWRIKFLTTGTLTVLTADWLVDLFLVGGGARGDAGTTPAASAPGTTSYGGAGGKGGTGGDVNTIKSLTVSKETNYTITIGGSGGRTSALSYTAASGGGSIGGAGGSGGKFPNPGHNGNSGPFEFGENGSTMYGSGGGGGGGGGYRVRFDNTAPGNGGAGRYGSGAGGTGGVTTSSTVGDGSSGSNGSANTGGGGGGGGGGASAGTKHSSGGSGGAGGSGIVIMRKHKEVA